MYLGDGLAGRAGPVRGGFHRSISDPMRSVFSDMGLICSIDGNLGVVIRRVLL